MVANVNAVRVGLYPTTVMRHGPRPNHVLMNPRSKLSQELIDPVPCIETRRPGTCVEGGSKTHDV